MPRMAWVVGVLAALLMPPSAGAQQGESLLRQVQELSQRNDHAATEAAASKLAAEAKARFGEASLSYGLAMRYLAEACAKQRKFEEAESFHGRAMAVFAKTDGPKRAATIDAINGLATAYLDRARYDRAEQHFKRALAISEQVNGPDDVENSRLLMGLMSVYARQQRFVESEQYVKRLLTAWEKTKMHDHPFYGTLLRGSATYNRLQGHYAYSEQLFKRALALLEKASVPDLPTIATTLNDLGLLYAMQRRYAEAEPYYRRSLEITERLQGPDRPELAKAVGDLASLYANEGRYAEAAQLYQRSVAIVERAYGAGHAEVARALLPLASLEARQGRPADAERIYQQAVALLEKAGGVNSPAVLDVKLDLALLQAEQGNRGAAESLYRWGISVTQKTSASYQITHIAIVDRLAGILTKQGSYPEARDLADGALTIVAKTHGLKHPRAADIFYRLAEVSAGMGDIEQALQYSRRATDIAAANVAEDELSRRPEHIPPGSTDRRTDHFRRHLDNLFAATSSPKFDPDLLGREAFEVAQRAAFSAAAAAIQQVSQRTAAGSGGLAALVREYQDADASWRAIDRQLFAEFSVSERLQKNEAIASLRERLASVESRRAAIAVQLEQQFPEYEALTKPKVLSVADVQKLLGGEEALAFFAFGAAGQSYVFVVSRDGFNWRPIAVNADGLAHKVAAVRRGLDLAEIASAAGRSKLFDIGLAHELYVDLFGAVDDVLKSKKRLLVVPSGTLTALPFHLLVTAQPTVAVPSDFAGYRDAAWLIKRQAPTVLPAVASLKALRNDKGAKRAAKAIVAFADPVFGSERLASSGAGAKLTVRAYSDYWMGAGVDREKLGGALPRLPDTGVEVKSIAQGLGAPQSDLYLRERATESVVKAMPLSDYRIVYFATHGLVAGDVKDLAEPSLALSTPRQHSESDDGLLTASEVALLRLNAEWVVLSACNTIAGDKPGAEALSGLARSFFYAGARALLVSHWAVDSEAAARLTVDTFNRLKTDAQIGRAEALRQAMLALLNDATVAKNAYPAFWGPFALIGEGAGR